MESGELHSDTNTAALMTQIWSSVVNINISTQITETQIMCLNPQEQCTNFNTEGEKLFCIELKLKDFSW